MMPILLHVPHDSPPEPWQMAMFMIGLLVFAISFGLALFKFPVNESLLYGVMMGFFSFLIGGAVHIAHFILLFSFSIFSKKLTQFLLSDTFYIPFFLTAQAIGLTLPTRQALPELTGRKARTQEQINEGDAGIEHEGNSHPTE
jgi:hypothetical protein